MSSIDQFAAALGCAKFYTVGLGLFQGLQKQLVWWDYLFDTNVSRTLQDDVKDISWTRQDFRLDSNLFIAACCGSHNVGRCSCQVVGIRIQPLQPMQKLPLQIPSGNLRWQYMAMEIPPQMGDFPRVFLWNKSRSWRAFSLEHLQRVGPVGPVCNVQMVNVAPVILHV